MDERARQYLERFAQLKADRQTWETKWEDLIAYVMPRKGFMTGSTSNKPTDAAKNDTSKIFNSTATTALRRLAAGMQSGLTSPMQPWFRLTLADADLAALGTVKAWLQAVEKRIYMALAKGGFYAAAHSIFAELGCFGNGCMFEGESDTTLINFRPFTIGEYFLAAGPSGDIDTVNRLTWWTAKSMVQEWGDACPERVRTLAQSQPYEYSRVLHIVQPREQRNPNSAAAQDMPFESVWVSYDDQEILAEGGFRVMPYMVSRWDTTGSEVYGRGQAEDILPDIKMLQEMEKTQLKALHKMADPPLLAPSTLKGMGGINTFPSGVTYTDQGGKDAMGPLYQVNFDVQNTGVKIKELEDRIAQGFFNDVFLMLLQQPNMTATEVMERSEEKILMLGPVIERQQTELLDPTISRTFDILWHRGRNVDGTVVNPSEVVLPDPPQEIQGAPIKVEYIGLLSQAQRMAWADGMNRFFQVVSPMAQMSPTVLDKLDLDKAIDEYASAYNVPAEIVRPDDEVAQRRQAQAQAQQEQQQALAAQQQAETAQTLAQADMSKPSALTAMLAQQQGQGQQGTPQ
jgi:hypothetical protein